MPLTAADLKFFAAARPTDNADGGGRRSSTLVQNGVDNNLFPDVTSADRVAGMTRLRKVYPSLTNADSTALRSAALVLNEAATDPATQIGMWVTGGAATERAAALAALAVGASSVDSAGGFVSGVATAASSVVTGALLSPDSAAFDAVNLGQWMLISTRNSNSYPFGTSLQSGQRYCLRRLVSRDVSGLTFDAPLPFSGTVSGIRVELGSSGLPRGDGSVFGSVPIFAAAAAGASSVMLAKPGVQLAPLADGAAYAGLPPGLEPLAGRRFSLGYFPAFYVGDAVTLSDERAATPATAVAGTPISVGRTNLDQLAVVGADGKEIARFLAGGPTPAPTSGALTCDLAAGTVTPSSVAGWSQPVTVRHRISHTATVVDVDGPQITLSAALPQEFPAGSQLSSHVPLGDMQARVPLAFAQQAWTRVFSDSLIGNPVTLPYGGTPAVTNQGAESDRWAIVFTAGNAFDCYSEALGLIASGNTTANFAPVNPATGAPFFTLLAASWVPGILVGSVYRFNTEGACSSVWVSRCTVPGTASGATKAALRLRGSVDV